ncbi:MAG: bacteriophage abortive infection AbiH family protein [Muribaculaceae bacterium]|nr:bacteriophage abortive infection AbiH family protein [Muribaculaceae bacterium]MCM1440383.1 bacteriophage abortive infection AbiH family protein [Roseburia sp.]
MTSQLVILGNGFDLQCGLKSSYKDFFRQCILDTTTINFGIKQMQADVTGFWGNLLLEYYKIYNKDDYKWCDIEKIIKDTLLTIYFGRNNSDKNINQGIYSKAKKYLNNFTVGLGLDKLNHIEKFLFDYCVKFISINGDFVETLTSLVRHLLQQLYNLENRFCKYLKNQIVNPINKFERNEDYIIKAVNLLASLTGFVCYKFNKIDDFITVKSKKYLIDVFDNLSNTFILNFNYTAIFDILEVESPCYYNNVHGKLCGNACSNGCDKSNIIFGIDDNLIQSQGASSELRLFSKTYRKMLSADKYLTVLPPNENNPIAIKFYGHSLSEADYSYFQSIFDYYDLYRNSNVSLAFYYSKGFENYDAVYKLISEYGKSLTNKEQGKNLIHKLLLENRLNIIKIN